MLRRKLWADTKALASQAISLTVLIALGILLFVGLYQGYQNLDDTYGAIYEQAHFADASVLTTLAPQSLVRTAETIPHVRKAIGRVVEDGTIIQKGRKRERVIGRFVGVPRAERPEINDLIIIEGRYITDDREAVLEQQFARETGYRIGEIVKCDYDTGEREFTIVGFAVSPEYLYPVPGKNQMWVSRGTFGVVFIDEDSARRWLGVGPRITEIHTLTDPGYENEVLEKLEGLVHSYGLETSYTQATQPSNHLLRMDQQGLATQSVFFPILFLGSAGLSLYGALARIVRLQVSVIGMLKACGFSDRHILVQHVVQGVLIALSGAIPGVILGHALSVWLGHQYVAALKLPLVQTPPRWDTIAIGLLMAAGTGLAASYSPAKVAARLQPAVAMRGDVESQESIGVQRRLVERTALGPIIYRIPLRGVFRRASRTLLALGGIAGGASIIITTLGMHVSMTDAIDETLTDSCRYQIDVTFARREGAPIARSVAALAGVTGISLTTSVPVKIQSSSAEGELMLMGFERGQRMLQVPSLSGRIIDVRPDSIWLPKQLGKKLGVEAGDPVRVRWANSSRRRSVGRTMRVAGMVDVAMGNTAYGEYNDIRRSFSDRLPTSSSFGAFVTCDPEQSGPLKRRLERSGEVVLVVTIADIAKQVNEQMKLMFIFIGILLSFGAVLAGSAIHSVASVSFLERTRELATLRSLGFASNTTGWLAAVELLVIAILGLIIGTPLGVKLNSLFMQSFATENMVFKDYLPPWVFAVTILIVLGLLGLFSYGGVRRLRAMDLSQATKARE